MQIYRKFHYLPAFVDGPSSLAATQGYTTIPAAGLFPCGLGPFEGFFGILEIVGDHGGKAKEQLCQVLSRPIHRRGYPVLRNVMYLFIYRIVLNFVVN